MLSDLLEQTPFGSIRFDQVRFDIGASVRLDSVRFDSIRFDSVRVSLRLSPPRDNHFPPLIGFLLICFDRAI